MWMKSNYFLWITFRLPMVSGFNRVFPGHHHQNFLLDRNDRTNAANGITRITFTILQLERTWASFWFDSGLKVGADCVYKIIDPVPAKHCIDWDHLIQRSLPPAVACRDLMAIYYFIFSTAQVLNRETEMMEIEHPRVNLSLGCPLVTRYFRVYWYILIQNLMIKYFSNFDNVQSITRHSFFPSSAPPLHLTESTSSFDHLSSLWYQAPTSISLPLATVNCSAGFRILK